MPSQPTGPANDRIVANLPARDLDETERFYMALGFETRFKSDGWLIMTSGSLELEFFLHAKLKPKESWHSASVRVADVDAVHHRWSVAGLPDQGIPRLTPPQDQPWGLREADLVDVNGSLLRILSPVA